MKTSKDNMTKESAQYRKNIKDMLKELGWTQEDLARRIGISRVALSYKMRGKPFMEDEMIAIMSLFRWKTICG